MTYGFAMGLLVVLGSPLILLGVVCCATIIGFPVGVSLITLGLLPANHLHNKFLRYDDRVFKDEQLWSKEDEEL